MPLGLTLGLFVGEEGGDGVEVCEFVTLKEGAFEDETLGVCVSEGVNDGDPVVEGVLLAVCVMEAVLDKVESGVLDEDGETDEEGVEEAVWDREDVGDRV